MIKCLVLMVVMLFWICDICFGVTKRATCGHNEMEIECAHCGPKTCDQLGYPIKCLGGTGICRTECHCVDGFVRNTKGVCIPKTECPTCGDDKNATTGCGNHCGNSCSDYQLNNTCLSGCRYNSCDCKKGYVFNESIKKCVLPDDCCK